MTTILAFQSNALELARTFGDIAESQLPYATAKALTDLAFQGQRESKTELRRAMNLRNPFSAGGIQVDPATKGQWPRPEAQVGIEERRSYLIDHVTGGKRQGGTHGRAIIEDETQRSSSGRVPASKRPAALVAMAKKAKRKADLTAAFGGRRRKGKALPFIFYSRKWGNEVLAIRMEKGRYPLRILYAFRKGVSIKREFEMDVAVRRTVQANYDRAFDKALRRAIGTAKGKGERGASSSRDQRIG